MITRTDLNERINEWGIREDVIEKDYVIGWVLWGIGSDPSLSSSWAFKGGTCLKKCYVETYRFSEDLDFTVLPGGPAEASQVIPLLKGVFERVYEESGIDFQGREPIVRQRPDGRSAEGRIYYRGPRNAPGVASLRLDLTTAEQVVRPTVLRPIAHEYPDALPVPAEVRCYSFEETFAEKLRAMGERARPRDLYDIIFLYRRASALPEAALLRSVYREKCNSKGVEVFTSKAIQASPFLRELEDEWANMLAHQLPALPPFSALSRIHRRRASGQCPEAARRCSCESGIMVLKQQTDPRKGAPNRCYHATTPTASKSRLTTTAWWPMLGCCSR